jgi:hypothetical protein
VEDRRARLALEEELERAADKVLGLDGARGKPLEVGAINEDAVLAGPPLVAQADAAAPGVTIGAAFDVDQAWHAGHQ